MHKVWLVIQREYFSRVKKRSFIVMTLLAPLLLAAFYILLILVSVSGEEKEHRVLVVDESATLISDHLRRYEVEHPDSKLKFTWKYTNYNEARDHLKDGEYDAILRFPENPVGHPNLIYYGGLETPAVAMKRRVEIEVEKIIEKEKLKSYNISQKEFDEIRQKINLDYKKIDPDKGTERSDDASIKSILGLILGMSIFGFIFTYGVQVLRGVLEEKTNRIIEVIASSVKPIQLMAGKIIGIALVGLTQFLILITFSGIVMSVVSLVFAPTVMEQVNQGSLETQAEMGGIEVGTAMYTINNLPYATILPMFVFYFIFGYLLYASIFAAIGAAVDSEADTQQFMWPVTLPIVFSIGIAVNVLSNPNGTLAMIFSFVPLTSPIVMMARLPFGGVHITEVLLSAVLLIAGFILTTWLAAKIYRTGILMYGKKITYKELWKWLFYKG